MELTSREDLLYVVSIPSVNGAESRLFEARLLLPDHLTSLWLLIDIRVEAS